MVNEIIHSNIVHRLFEVDFLALKEFFGHAVSKVTDTGLIGEYHRMFNDGLGFFNANLGLDMTWFYFDLKLAFFGLIIAIVIKWLATRRGVR